MTARAIRRPVFGRLSEREARALLRRNHVGRICFVRERVVDVEPVHYAAEGDWIYVRSARGTKTVALEHRPYVAFEVDEVRDTFDWRSVVVHGTVYAMVEHGDPVARAQFGRAIEALRAFLPETLTTRDPIASRGTVYGIHIDLIEGRSAEERRPRVRPPARRSPSPPPREARRKP